LKAGDIVDRVDGGEVRRVARLLELIQKSDGKRLEVMVERAGDRLTIPVTPRREEDGNYRIGSRLVERPGFVGVGLGTALRASFAYPVYASAEALGFLKKLITRDISTKQVGGPVEIVAQLSGTIQFGWVVVLLMAAKLNVILGLFNLLPLPALDGGRLAFLGAEIVTRRRVNQRFEFALHTIGFLLLLVLILLVTY
jgi:regulator of sigma E protease